MKLLIYPEFDHYGGTKTFFLNLLEHHANEKIETAVVLTREQRDWFEPNFFSKRNIRVFICPKRPAIFFKCWFSLLFDFFALLPAFIQFNPDGIVVSNGTPGIMFGATLLNLPILYIFHTYPIGKMRESQRLFLSAFFRNSVQFAAVSQATAFRVSEFMGIPYGQILILYNSFNPYGHTDSEEKHNNNVVLTLGHLSKQKNPQAWIQVADAVIKARPNTRFTWVGHGPLTAFLNDEICGRKLNDRVSLKGFRSEVYPFYRKATIYFQPSLMESHGISILDAMALGIPCVASNVGGISESIINGQTGFLHEPGDIEGFAKSIIHLLDNEDLRAQLGRHGALRANQLFSPDVWKSNIKKVYRSIFMVNLNR